MPPYLDLAELNKGCEKEKSIGVFIYKQQIICIKMCALFGASLLGKTPIITSKICANSTIYDGLNVKHKIRFRAVHSIYESQRIQLIGMIFLAVESC